LINCSAIIYNTNSFYGYNPICPNRTITGKFTPIQFIAVGDNGYIMSETKLQQVGINNWCAIAYGNNRYVSVGYNGYITTSSDGINWTPPNQVGGTVIWEDIMFENGYFVIISTNHTYSSSLDGINWATIQNFGFSVNGVGHGNGIFAAVNFNGRISTSTNGTTWISSNKNSGTNMSGLGISDKWIIGCTSGGFLYRSGDGGNTWKSSFQDPIRPKKIVYGNNIFVGINSQKVGYALNSEFLSTFYKATVDDSISWSDATFGNNNFLLLNAAGYISFSIDGANWTTPEQLKDESGKAVTANLNGVCIMP